MRHQADAYAAARMGEPSMLLAPLVERCTADTRLGTDPNNHDAERRMLKRASHLLLGELALPHGLNAQAIKGAIIRDQSVTERHANLEQVKYPQRP
jgi:hypothetical protein